MRCILVTKKDHISLLFAHDFIGIQQKISWNPTIFLKIQQELSNKTGPNSFNRLFF